MTELINFAEANRVIQLIAAAVKNRAVLAGVGSMELAGQLVSVLAGNPEWQREFFADPGEFMLSGKFRAENGILTWHSKGGEIMSAAEYIARTEATNN